MAQKDVGNKIPIYKLKTTDEVMKYYDDWGIKNKYDKDMEEWNYTGPKETSKIFDLIVNNLNNNDYLMIKGSNSTGLNKFVKILKRKKLNVI